MKDRRWVVDPIANISGRHLALIYQAKRLPFVGGTPLVSEEDGHAIVAAHNADIDELEAENARLKPLAEIGAALNDLDDYADALEALVEGEEQCPS